LEWFSPFNPARTDFGPVRDQHKIAAAVMIHRRGDFISEKALGRQLV
jgi:hypothetical protein